MVDVSLLFGVVLLADAVAVVVLLWTENFTRFEGVVLWEEESPVAPLFWGSVIVLLAGVVSLFEIPLTARPQVRVNVGGVLAPMAVCAILFWRRRPEIASALLVTGATTAGTLAATAISREAFTLPFPWNFLPAGIAAISSVYLSKDRTPEALEIAYLGAVLGCFLGLDLIPYGASLSSPAGPSDVTFGAGGILDLVFLSGVFAVAIAWVAGFLRARFLRRGPARPLAVEPGDPDALRRAYDEGRSAR